MLASAPRYCYSLFISHKFPVRTEWRKATIPVSLSSPSTFFPSSNNNNNNNNAHRSIRLAGATSSSGEDNRLDEMNKYETSWVYEPYKKPASSSTNKSSWKSFSTAAKNGKPFYVPEKLTIPADAIELSFVRSSGAGGQNVNKVNTKVELKLHLMTANWLPMEVRERIQSGESNRIGKDGYLTITSQEYRTQVQNRKAAMDKLEELLLRWYPRPKVRKMRRGISTASKEKNKEQKKRRSSVKQNRKRVDF